MSANPLRSYLFFKEAQWNACLFARVQRDSGGTVGPIAPYARPGTHFDSAGGHAPAITQAGEILWCDGTGDLLRLTASHDEPERRPAPGATARARRMVATSHEVWVVDRPRSLQSYEDDSLARILTVDVQDGDIVDIASDGRNRIMALVNNKDGDARAVVVDRRGHVVDRVSFTGFAHPRAFVYLRQTKQFVVLAGRRHRRIYWFSTDGGRALFSKTVAAFRPCFTARVLGSDSRNRVLIAGVDHANFGGGRFVIVLDADGNVLDEIRLDARATGIAASRDGLVVTDARGLLRFKTADVVPDEAGPIRCTVLTPMLHSPDRPDRRRWLRAEATTTLPEGTTLEMTWAATNREEVRDRVSRMLADTSVAESYRIAALLADSELRHGRTEFRGTPAVTDATVPFSLPLFEIDEPYIWVAITMTAGSGARLPQLSKLAVLYPGQTLMQSLPAIYQAEEDRSDSFLRALVGVLESTTQGLDARIASMGRRIHPATADGPWLDFIARWLGVPWDDTMTLDQKRRIVTRASSLAQGRGTRAGLEALLDALLPGAPRRFQVVDATADFGFAVVGGDGCQGSALPAMLGGRTEWNAELGTDAVLGYMRLPCAGQLTDGVWQLAGRIRVDIAASADEKKAWQPWLRAVIQEMVPLTATLKLNWVSAYALRSNRLDGTMTLEPPPAPHLGTDALTGLARLPERGARLSSSGTRMSTRLR